MPNYKVFQDYADSMRVRVYGSDSGGNIRPLLTDASGKTDVVNQSDKALYVRGDGVSGTPVYVKQQSGVKFAVSGDMTVQIDSGDIITVVNNSGNALYVRSVSGDPLATSGFAFNESGNALYVRSVSGDPLATSGFVFNESGNALYVRSVSGDPLATSGVVFNESGNALYVRSVSGDPLATSGFVFNTSGNPLYIANRAVFSGSAAVHTSGGALSSGVVGVIWPVLGYDGPSFAVKYSGASGAQMKIKIQDAAVSGDANFIDDGTVSNDFSGKTWNILSPTHKLRYSRVYYQYSGTNSGQLLLYYQTERS